VFWAGPHRADHRDPDESLDGPFTCSGWGSGATTNTFRFLSFGKGRLPDTLLGFEATGPLVLRPCGETGTVRALPGTGQGVEFVSAPLGGGVWCLICG
jgi:hypothetical protein